MEIKYRIDFIQVGGEQLSFVSLGRPEDRGDHYYMVDVEGDSLTILKDKVVGFHISEYESDEHDGYGVKTGVITLI